MHNRSWNAARALSLILVTATACTGARTNDAPPSAAVTWAEIAALHPPAAGTRIPYGSDPLQFGELRVPAGDGSFPTVIFIHGGCWRSQFDLTHVAPVAHALTQAGFATWTIEYRRIGNEGGAWPGTFTDVAAAADHLRLLAPQHRLDLTRVVAAGHSAGGHLALWLAARKNLPAENTWSKGALPIRGVVALAAISDLRSYAASPGSCNAAVKELLGGSPSEQPERVALVNPLDLLPLRVPVRLVHGAEDATVPLAQSREFAARAVASGDDARVASIPGAGHFDVIAPFAPAWQSVLRAVRETAGR